MKKRKKYTLLVLRIVLFSIGAVLGFFAMRFIALAHPDSAFDINEYIYCCASGLLLGIVLMLSAKSAMWLFSTLYDGIKSAVKGAKPSNIVCVLIGIAAGVMLTWLFDFLLGFALDIVELKIMLDVVFAFLSVVGLSVAALKIFSAVSPYTKQSESVPEFKSGYLLTSSALGCEGIAEFCRDWLIGGAAVLDCTVSALISRGASGADALAAYGKMQKDGSVYTVSAGKSTEREAVLRCARERGLRIIAAYVSEYGGESVHVLGYMQLRGKDDLFPECGEGVALSEKEPDNSGSEQESSVSSVKAIDEI